MQLCCTTRPPVLCFQCSIVSPAFRRALRSDCFLHTKTGRQKQRQSTRARTPVPSGRRHRSTALRALTAARRRKPAPALSLCILAPTAMPGHRSAAPPPMAAWQGCRPYDHPRLAMAAALEPFLGSISPARRRPAFWGRSDRAQSGRVGRGGRRPACLQACSRCRPRITGPTTSTAKGLQNRAKAVGPQALLLIQQRWWLRPRRKPEAVTAPSAVPT